MGLGARKDVCHLVNIRRTRPRRPRLRYKLYFIGEGTACTRLLPYPGRLYFSTAFPGDDSRDGRLAGVT